MQRDAIWLRLSGKVTPEPAIGIASANLCKREVGEGMELSAVTVVILVMAGVHLALDCMRWLVYGSRAGVRATSGE